MLSFFDTFMNLLVFAFIGLLIWLYFYEPKIEPPGRDDQPLQD